MRANPKAAGWMNCRARKSFWDWKAVLNVNLYADAAYDFKQMEQIRLGLEHGIDVTKLLNPLIPSDVMMNMRLESEALKK